MRNKEIVLFIPCIYSIINATKVAGSAFVYVDISAFNVEKLHQNCILTDFWLDIYTAFLYSIVCEHLYSQNHTNRVIIFLCNKHIQRND